MNRNPVATCAGIRRQREISVFLLTFLIMDVPRIPNESITKAIVAMAESLSLDIVAEGIETMSEQTVLEKLGRTEGQGYLFAKPLAAAEMFTWIKQNNSLSIIK